MTLQHQKQFLPQDINKNHTSKTCLYLCFIFIGSFWNASNAADPLDILEVELLMK